MKNKYTNLSLSELNEEFTKYDQELNILEQNFTCKDFAKNPLTNHYSYQYDNMHGIVKNKEAKIIFHPFHSLKKNGDKFVLSPYWTIVREDTSYFYAVHSSIKNTRTGEPLKFCLNYQTSAYVEFYTTKYSKKFFENKDIFDFEVFCEFLDRGQKEESKWNSYSYKNLNRNVQANLKCTFKQYWLERNDASVIDLINNIMINFYNSYFNIETKSLTEFYKTFEDYVLFNKFFLEEDAIHLHEGFYLPLMKMKKEYLNKRTSVKKNLSDIKLVIDSRKNDLSIEELKKQKQSVREQKIAKNKALKLGKSFEHVTRLTLALTKLKSSIDELEKKLMTSEDEIVDFNYSGIKYKINKIDELTNAVNRITNNK